MNCRNDFPCVNFAIFAFHSGLVRLFGRIGEAELVNMLVISSVARLGMGDWKRMLLT